MVEDVPNTTEGGGTPIARGPRPRSRMAGQVLCPESLRISALHNRARNSTEEDKVTWRKEKRSCEKKLLAKEAEKGELLKTIQELKILISHHP